ncbi:hypothetical protein MMC28_004981 [Mycoblastus sanguinarius]|nr:hypothetical protein [Mycoblastus sanguinarius]
MAPVSRSATAAAKKDKLIESTAAPSVKVDQKIDMPKRWVQSDGERDSSMPGKVHYDEELHNLDNTNWDTIKATYPPY